MRRYTTLWNIIILEFKNRSNSVSDWWCQWEQNVLPETGRYNSAKQTTQHTCKYQQKRRELWSKKWGIYRLRRRRGAGLGSWGETEENREEVSPSSSDCGAWERHELSHPSGVWGGACHGRKRLYCKLIAALLLTAGDSKFLTFSLRTVGVRGPSWC